MAMTTFNMMSDLRPANNFTSPFSFSSRLSSRLLKKNCWSLSLTLPRGGSGGVEHSIERGSPGVLPRRWRQCPEMWGSSGSGE